MFLFLGPFALAQTVVDEPRWVSELAVDAGVGEWRIRDALVFPLRYDDRDAGFVAVGPGVAEVTFAERWEAWVAAARLDLPGAPWAAARVEGPRTWDLPIEVAVSFGDRPGDAAWRAAPLATVDGAGVSYVGGDGREQVVVNGFDYRRAYERARSAVRRRAAALGAVDLPPEVLVRVEGRAPAGRWIGDVETAQPLGALLGPGSDAYDSRWLTFTVDPSGLVDPALSEVAWVLGHTGDDRPRLQALTGRGAVRPPVTVARGVSNVVLTPVDSRRALDVSVETSLTLDARAPRAVVPLVLPSAHPESVAGEVVLPDRLRLEGATDADGRSLPKIDGAFGWIARLPGASGLWVVECSAPCKVRLTWTDRWLLSHDIRLQEWVTEQWRQVEWRYPKELVYLDVTRVPEQVSLGARVVGRPVWPMTVGGAYPTQLRVGTTWPALRVSVGASAEPLPRDDGAWVRAEGSSAHRVSVALGTTDRYGATLGFPEIVVPRDVSKELPPAIRAVLNYYSTVLPAMPARHLDVVFAPDRPIADLIGPSDERADLRLLAPEVHSSVGVIEVRGRVLVHVPLLLRSGYQQDGTPILYQAAGAVGSKRTEQAVTRSLAEALIQQWFLPMELPPRSAWVSAGAGAYFRDRFVADAWSDRIERTWDQYERGRADVLDAAPSGLAPLGFGPEPWSGQVGGALLTDLLSHRIGERSLHRGIADFVAGDDTSVDALRVAWERASGVPLQDLLDSWFLAGLRPKVEAEILDGQLWLRAYPPVGAQEVPVEIHAKAVEVVWVPVVDGVGQWEVPDGVGEVVVDPRGLLGAPQRLIR